MNSNLDFTELRSRNAELTAPIASGSASLPGDFRHANVHDDHLSPTMQKLAAELQGILRNGLMTSVQRGTRDHLPGVAAAVGNRVGQAVAGMLAARPTPGPHTFVNLDNGPPRPTAAADTGPTNGGQNDPVRARMREFVTKALEKSIAVFQAVDEGLYSLAEFAITQAKAATLAAHTWAESLRPSANESESQFNLHEALSAYALTLGPVIPAGSYPDQSPAVHLALYVNAWFESGQPDAAAARENPYLTETQKFPRKNNRAVVQALQTTLADRVLLELPSLDGISPRWMTLFRMPDRWFSRTWMRYDTYQISTQHSLLNGLNPNNEAVTVHVPSNHALRTHARREATSHRNGQPNFANQVTDRR